MASVDHGRAYLSLLSDPAGSLVMIPFLSAMSTPFTAETVFVRFAGDTYPTAFDGEGQDWQFVLTCLFPRAQHAELQALLALLRDRTRAAADKRLLLRTHAGLAPGLNPAVAVRVDGQVTPTWTAPAVTVQFTARVVESTVYA